MKNAIYETSLTDAQWAYLKPMLPKPAKRGRPPTDRRRILDAILYVVKCGCPWRYLPTDFPPWKTVYHISVNDIYFSSLTTTIIPHRA